MRKRPPMLLASLTLACLGAGPADDPPASQGQRPGAAALADKNDGSAGRPEDVKALGALVRAFTDAYNKGDAKAIAELFAENAEVTEESGATVRGREAVAGLFAAAFEQAPKATIELAPESLRFLGPDAARETGRSRATPAGGGAPDLARYTVLYVRWGGRWLQDSVHEYPDRSLTPHERLQELAWLVGEWVDEGDEGVVETSCHWSDDKNYLIRKFTMRISGQPVTGGTQRIGWDPRSEQIKSWVFDNDGGYSEGLWSRLEKNRWVIKADGVLADGKCVSATQILTYVNKDLARWRSVDRTIGGQAVPDLTEVVLVRTPPKPASATEPLPSPKTSRKP
jgi:uncharacterized protein (TIGR02246 family)